MPFALDIVREGAGLLRTALPVVEGYANTAGYIPYRVHRDIGGLRIVYGNIELISGLALWFLVEGWGTVTRDKELANEGRRLLDFAVHGGANMVRGFIEVHPGINLVCWIYDKYVPENGRFNYHDPIFGEKDGSGTRQTAK